MRPVTDTFLRTLRVPHVVAFAATLTLPGDAPVVLALSSGSVTIDRSAQTRRTAQVTVPWSLDPEVLANAGLNVDVRLAPFGGTVELERGVAYPDGTRELAGLGLLRVDAVAWQTTQAAATLSLVDRMAQVADTKLLTPYAPTGLTATAAIVELVEAVFGATIGYHVTPPPGGEPPLVDVTYSDDRARAVGDLARSVGCEAYFDAAGDLVVAPVPTPDDPPVWTVDAGEDGVMIDASESLERAGVINGVLVRGQPAADLPPIEALVTDDDPESPLRYGGPFGMVVEVVQTDAVQTVEQAAGTAASLLDSRRGLARTITLDAVPNPALEAGDVVTVVFPDGRTEAHLIEAVGIPLDAAAAVTLASRAVFVGDAIRSAHRTVRTGRDAYAAMAGALAMRAA